ncbi:MAG: B12-binding domain-containing radical SAM protein, partial [bacterium]
IRKYAPKTKIILGGHGTTVPNIENLMEYDHICIGEGVSFLRKLFGENLNQPIKHPIQYSSFNRRIMGVPLKEDSGVLITGVGCANKCRFCATSHFFGEYTSFLQTGKQIFDVCCEYEKQLGVTEFTVLDENFLKTKHRALELIEIMEQEKKSFSFAIFSSAETLKDIGDLDLLIRLGVTFIWIGVESKKDAYEKNANTDFKHLVHELRKRGISVLASAIMFLEHHDKNSIWEDVEFATSLNPDYLQFMQLGPIPNTALYLDYEKKDLLFKDLDYKTMHGQKKIWFKHPHFSRDDSQRYLKEAFVRDYTTNGASLLRAIKTSMMGYKYCMSHQDRQVRKKASRFFNNLQLMRYFLQVSNIFKENLATKRLIESLKNDFNEEFGKPSLKIKILSLLVSGFAIKEWLRIKFYSDVRKPPTSIKRYRQVAKQTKELKACCTNMKVCA